MEYGGNTTSLRVQSDCLPAGWALVVDTGSGFVPLSQQLLSEGIMNIAVLYTHWHHDHTQGLLLAPHTFISKAEIKVWGPEEHNVGPVEILSGIMKKPEFPVDFAMVRHRFKCSPLKHIGTQVLIVHPKAGFHLMDINRYHECEYANRQMSLGGGKYHSNECLVIFMHKTDHPEYSVSYRFQEKPTNRAFVFLTDHENTAGIPNDLLLHVKKADLLVQDGQYSSKMYKERTSGFGHGTPEYCAEVMFKAGVGRLGITHHDPFATDVDVNQRVREARVAATSLDMFDAENRIFGCADYMSVLV
jgi:phosphoribosyl 1,2-cyclic phosphodiesterase